MAFRAPVRREEWDRSQVEERGVEVATWTSSGKCVVRRREGCRAAREDAYARGGTGYIVACVGERVRVYFGFGGCGLILPVV